MRPEEEFVCDRLVDFLGGPEVASYRPGGDPPDAIVKNMGQEFFVEVTQMVPVTLEEPKKPKSRLTDDVSALRLLDELDREFTARLGNLQVFVHLRVPWRRPSRFRKCLRATLASIVNAPNQIKDNQLFIVDGEEVHIRILDEKAEGSNGVVGFVENTSASADIHNNACAILTERIEIKEGIYAKKQFGKPRWLALLNTYGLADFHTFKHALDEICISHGFEKIFYTSRTGKIQVLYQN